MAKPKAKVQIVVDVKTAKAVSSIKGMVRQNNQLMQKMLADTKKGAGGFSKMQSAIVSVNAAVGLARNGFFAFRRVLQGVMTLVQMAADQRTGIAQMASAFDGLVQPAGLAVQALEDFATTQQEVTRFGDDQTRRIATQFATMASGSIQSISQVIDATRLVQDASERLGKSTARITLAIAKLYAGDLAAIETLLPGQRALTQELRTMEDQSEAAARALQLVTDAYGGAAAELDPVTQALAENANLWGDLKEAIGDTLTEIALQGDAFDGVTSGLRGMIDLVESQGFADSLGLLGFYADALIRLQSISTLGGLLVTAATGEDDGEPSVVARGLGFRTASRGAAWPFSGTGPRDVVDRQRERRARVNQEMFEAQAEQLRQEQEAERAALRAAAEAEQDRARRLRDRERLTEQKQREADAAAARSQRFLGLGKFSGMGGGARLGEQATPEELLQSLMQLAPEVGETFASIGTSLSDAFSPVGDELERLADIAGTTKEAWADVGDSIAGSILVASMQMGKMLGSAAMGGAVEVRGVFAGMFDTLGAAATAAAAAQASVSAMFPFLGLAIGASVFSGMLGGSSKAKPSASTGARATTTEDVFTGLRPEADRGGRAIFVNQSFGAVFNTDDTRREISRLRDDAIIMGEARVSNG